MRDPFPPCPEFLVKLVTPYAQKVGLNTFPLHAHEALFAFTFYHCLNSYISPALSPKLFPRTYNVFNRRNKINWDVHIVALFQSVFICSYSLYVMAIDDERSKMDRVFGYSGLAGTVQAFGWGYFAWDLMVSARYLKIFGPGLLAHAVSALAVFSLGFVSNYLF